MKASDIVLATIGACIAIGCIVALVAGVSVNANRKDAPTPQSTVTKTVTISPTPTPEETPTETPVEDETLKYGQTYLYPEGLKVTVVGYKTYPKDPTIKMGHKYYKLFTVKVKATVNQYHTEEWYTESPGGEETATEGNGQPGGQLAAGKTLTFTVVYGYDDTTAPELTFAACPDTVYLCEPHTWA